jgi:hypothetical protein
MTAPRVFQDAAPFANSGKGGPETALIIALGFAFAGALDPKRLASPELAPALARRVRHNRMRPGIQAGIPRLIPRINAG